MLNVLMAHNHYQQPGGEDQSFKAEADLLEARGVKVRRYTVHNDQIDAMARLSVAAATVWNRQSQRDLRRLLRDERPDIVHFQNTFPLISPAAHHEVKKEGIAVVQSLRNYRLFCLNSLFFRDGHVCEDCFGKLPWPGVQHACYRESRAASGVVSLMLTAHRLLKTWLRKVDIFIALTHFAKDKFVAGGLPAERIIVKPNFVYPDPGVGSGQGGFALFVGRLSAEKGVVTLLSAWRNLGRHVPLKIVGDGPLAPQVEAAAARLPNVTWLGRKPVDEVYTLMGEAALLVFPSEWYETFGRVAIEAFAKGTPVVAANIGAIAEVVEHDRTGLHFRPGNADELAAQVERLLATPDRMKDMRHEARRVFEEHYSSEENYRRLTEIYALAQAKGAANTSL